MSAPTAALRFLCLLATAGLALGAEPEFKSLFNGKDLSGWDGDPRYWSVSDGAIRGQTSFRSLPLGNTFLIWRGGVLKDFELRLKVRLQSGNSGVQYRSRSLGKWAVRGYQAEVENTQGKAGFLYEEKGRGFLARVGEKVEIDERGKRQSIALPLDRLELIKQGYYREKDWNDYVIVARGNRLTHWLNGLKTVELTDNDPASRVLEGILALQIHAGPPMRVEFKDIQLRSFQSLPSQKSP